MELGNYEGKYEIIKFEENMPFFIGIHRRINVSILEHWHDSLEINHYFISGVNYYIDGNQGSSEDDHICIINCNSVHKFNTERDYEDSEEITGITLIINHEFLKSVIPDVEHCVFIAKSEVDKDRLKGIMRKILEEYINDSSEYKNIKITGLVYELLYCLCIDFKEDKSIIHLKKQKEIERLKEIMKYVDKHYKEPILQKDIAKNFYLSREHFSRFFKTYTGITFKEYLTKYRLVEAEKKLRFTDSNIIDIAMNTGFSDSRQFINSFKKYYSITPYQYKKNITKR